MRAIIPGVLLLPNVLEHCHPSGLIIVAILTWFMLSTDSMPVTGLPSVICPPPPVVTGTQAVVAETVSKAARANANFDSDNVSSKTVMGQTNPANLAKLGPFHREGVTPGISLKGHLEATFFAK